MHTAETSIPVGGNVWQVGRVPNTNQIKNISAQMKTASFTVALAGNIQLRIAQAVCIFAACSAFGASEQWLGVPGLSATTNWTDAANWGNFSGFGSSTPPQTYFNQVQFT